MSALGPMTRRNVVAGLAAASVPGLFPTPSIAQTAARIVVIGGGFAGACCARALRQIDSHLQVALIEPNRIFTACPFSNEVIAGLREMAAQQFSYDRIAASGITVIAEAAVRIDPQQRQVTLSGGAAIGYERLVLAPGIDLRFDALPGYDEAASALLPHAWQAGAQTLLLRRQLEAMDDGGVVALAVPANPSRCPPAPYERASLIAHYLARHKPRSKILILDAKDAFPQQRLFEQAWRDLYPGMIERISLSQGGRVIAVDAARHTLITDFGDYSADVINVIPPQKAGRIADLAGAVDHTGWCPIDPVSFASVQVPNLHVIGDACLGGGIPKSASAAHAEAKACAGAIVSLLSGEEPAMPRPLGTCYSVVAPGYGFSQSGIYQPKDGLFVEVDGSATSSPLDAPAELRTREAEQARRWYESITVDSFG